MTSSSNFRLPVVVLCLSMVTAPWIVSYAFDLPKPTFPCVGPKVIDGDTIRCERIDLGFSLSMGHQIVRVAGVDTPESLRPACEKERLKGERAKKATALFLEECSELVVIDPDKDKYGRILGDLLCVTSGNMLSVRLLSLGLARPYFGKTKVSWCD